MATFTPSPIITDISGSVGNFTFQKNAYGYSLRGKPRLTNSPSFNQVQSRNFIALIKSAWNNLSHNDRQLWFLYAQTCRALQSSGSARNLSDYNLFFSHNLLLLHAGADLLSSLTFYQNTPQYSEPYFYSGVESFGFDLENFYDNDLYVIFVKITPPLRRTVRNVDSLYRVIIPDVSNPPSVELYSAYVALFGRAPGVGDYVYFSFQFIHRYSPYVQSVYFDKFTF